MFSQCLRRAYARQHCVRTAKQSRQYSDGNAKLMSEVTATALRMPAKFTRTLRCMLLHSPTKVLRQHGANLSQWIFFDIPKRFCFLRPRCIVMQHHGGIAKTMRMQSDIIAKSLRYGAIKKKQKTCAFSSSLWLGYHDDVTKWKHCPRYWPFMREFTGHRDAELWCFLWSAPE